MCGGRRGTSTPCFMEVHLVAWTSADHCHKEASTESREALFKRSDRYGQVVISSGDLHRKGQAAA
jgi:hypothetical protein